VWRAALDARGQMLTVENVNAWLASTRALGQDGEVLRVAVPAAFNKTWLEQKLHGKVTGALQKIDDDTLGTGRVGRVERVEYVVEGAARAPTDPRCGKGILSDGTRHERSTSCPCGGDTGAG